MQYVQIRSTDAVVKHTTDALSSRLNAGERVVWLLSGGSAIALEVEIAKALQRIDTSLLWTGLMDERYGPLGHQDENYTQLITAGFSLPLQRVLTGDAPEKTAEVFGQNVIEALQQSTFSLGIFGIGADGHTAGIKAGSPATASSEPAVFYDWDDYRRITLTPPALLQLDEAIVYAIGKEKQTMLGTLTQKELAIHEQPAQLLKQIKTATLYTDALL